MKKTTTFSFPTLLSAAALGALIGCGDLGDGDVGDPGAGEPGPPAGPSTPAAVGALGQLRNAAPLSVAGFGAQDFTLAAAQQKPSPAVRLDLLNDPDPALALEGPPEPVVRELEAGDGWRRVSVAGDAEDGETGVVKKIDEAEYYVFQGRAALSKSPLPAKTKTALMAGVARKTEGAKGDPEDDPTEEVIVIPRKLVDNVESGVATSAPAGFAFWSLCGDDDYTYEKQYSFDKKKDFHKADEAGSFQGTADFKSRLKGWVKATVKYTVKQDEWSACVPWLVIRSVRVAGAADVLASADVKAKFEKSWNWQREIFAPVLGTVTLPVFPVPLTFKAPITVGIDASAKAELNASGAYEAHGNFNLLCRSSGCTGSKSATHGFTPTGTPTYTATGMVKVKPWVEGALRVFVVSEWVASAQVGVRAGLATDLFGYSGLSCGDADHNGSNELVNGLTMDMNIDIDVLAKVKFLGDNHGPWTLYSWDKHLAFWSFGGNLLNPIFYNQTASSTLGAKMRGTMRPCWPYTDNVQYRITWSDGAITTFWGSPDTLFTQEHLFAAYGTVMVKLEALKDAKGRVLGGVMTDQVVLSPFTFPGGDVLSTR